MLPIESASKTFVEKLLAYGVAAKSNAPAGVPARDDGLKAATAGATVGVPMTAILAVLAYIAANTTIFVDWLGTLGVSHRVLYVLTAVGGLAGMAGAAYSKYWGLVAMGPRITLDPRDPARPHPAPPALPPADAPWDHPIDGVIPPTVEFRPPGAMRGDGPT